jgi:hypothetical protein
VNRLIIIGNGFDLAHGMKTSYNAFMFDYLTDVFDKAFRSWDFEDELLKIEHTHNQRIPVGHFTKLSDFLAVMPLYGNSNSPGISINIKSKFLRELLESLNEVSWVDVEQKYFDLLKRLNASTSTKAVLDLNHDMEVIKKLLIKYLRRLSTAKPAVEISNIFKSSINSDLYFEDSLDKDIRSEFPVHTYFLDFNYTDLVEQYLIEFPFGALATHIKIHGSLKDESNPIIFGFGDEMDSEYKKIELSGNKDALKYIKSFGYSLTDQYRRLFYHLGERPFEVYVIGHSCGLSDRVMLSEIFQSANCKFIRLFYYQKSDNSDNFVELSQSIAQHFSIENRHKMRLKVTSKSPMDLLPKLC